MDIDKHKGILLDIGCGANKQPGFVGMDRREIPGVDIVHDLETFPYPLEDEACISIVGSHIIEHIKPWLMIDLMDELWRILKPGGRLALAMPYAGSFGYWQDPTHCNGCNEATWDYFDPDKFLYQIYRPQPWTILPGYPVWQATGNMEVVLEKRAH
jgi:SAM-dependent methyltransferase